MNTDKQNKTFTHVWRGTYKYENDEVTVQTNIKYGIGISSHYRRFDIMFKITHKGNEGRSYYRCATMLRKLDTGLYNISVIKPLHQKKKYDIVGAILYRMYKEIIEV